MNKIIGYIHICQAKNWERSFDLLWKEIIEYGLYEKSDCIRIGVVIEKDFIHDKRFDDPKINIIFNNKPSSLYERPTLLHMRNESTIENAFYWYIHTKGISHFDKETEPFVIDWVKLLLYWNVRQWNYAIHILDSYDTYGCNYNGSHYSGNFWWATSSYVKTLPTYIENYYIAPEDWICKNVNVKAFSSFNSNTFHYYLLYPPTNYIYAPLDYKHNQPNYILLISNLIYLRTNYVYQKYFWHFLVVLLLILIIYFIRKI